MAERKRVTIYIERRPQDDGLRIWSSHGGIVLSHPDRDMIIEDLASILRETIHACLPPKSKNDQG